jgi:predicted RNase H-like nuclease
LKLPEEGTVGSLARLKPYEDALDALVSAWIGLEYLAGRATALGDEQAAVWVPTDVVLNRELRMG